MVTGRRASKRVLLATVLAALGLLVTPVATEGAPKADKPFKRNPMLFVHGFSGSGAQFESQKMRFASNGYPMGHVEAIDYDSTFATESMAQVWARMDQQIAELQQRTGRDQVELIGHSLGTTVSQQYLKSSPERAADVSHYVNIDGSAGTTAPPVPTLAIWAGRGAPGRSVAGATNVTIPNQTHVQVATSPESFAEMYRFFTGEPPETTEILREPNRSKGQITVAGRALLFPHNRGNVGTTLEIFEVDPATGQRIGAPVAQQAIDEGGNFGPVAVQAGRHYEFAVARAGEVTLHYYYEPFIRSDHLIRLLDSPALNALIDKGPNHEAVVLLRYKEFWGDQSAENDVLTINGTNICTAAICPISKQVNAIFAFDRGADGQTDLSRPDPAFNAFPFVTGADIFIPASIPPTGITAIGLQSRGSGTTRTINVPNFAALTDGAIIQFNDFE
jgi:pimeloyl-ACP methyl ester carboxylesterase